MKTPLNELTVGLTVRLERNLSDGPFVFKGVVKNRNGELFVWNGKKQEGYSMSEKFYGVWDKIELI